MVHQQESDVIVVMNTLYIGLRVDYRRKRQVSSWLIDDLLRNDEGAECRRIVVCDVQCNLVAGRAWRCSDSKFVL
jgi:hypothetical protein